MRDPAYVLEQYEALRAWRPLKLWRMSTGVRATKTRVAGEMLSTKGPGATGPTRTGPEAPGNGPSPLAGSPPP